MEIQFIQRFGYKLALKCDSARALIRYLLCFVYFPN